MQGRFEQGAFDTEDASVCPVSLYPDNLDPTADAKQVEKWENSLC